MVPTSDIRGWFDFEQTYDFLIDKVPENGRFLEAGVFAGKSASYLIDNSRHKNIEVSLLDMWWKDGLYEEFRRNIAGRDYHEYRMPSNKAAEQFADSHFDCVFIDMDHKYDSIYADIGYWYPKVKLGGYIAGHDYNEEVHPGVFRAVNELIRPKGMEVMPAMCWVHKKESVRL